MSGLNCLRLWPSEGMKMVMNLIVAYHKGITLTVGITISYSRFILYHGDSKSKSVESSQYAGIVVI